jgi:hypothetical protein
MESIATSTSSFFNNNTNNFYFDFNQENKNTSEITFENSFDCVSTIWIEREL